mmetsp:Transcript_29407/g.83734  ORF Transcript_29407/g.83734 Transcript_29407/m.83734 type:complete len:267 (+) Transcript_29407:936-1736(+)
MGTGAALVRRPCRLLAPVAHGLPRGAARAGGVDGGVPLEVLPRQRPRSQGLGDETPAKGTSREPRRHPAIAHRLGCDLRVARPRGLGKRRPQVQLHHLHRRYLRDVDVDPCRRRGRRCSRRHRVAADDRRQRACKRNEGRVPDGPGVHEFRAHARQRLPVMRALQGELPLGLRRLRVRALRRGAARLPRPRLVALAGAQRRVHARGAAAPRGGGPAVADVRGLPHVLAHGPRPRARRRGAPLATGRELAAGGVGCAVPRPARLLAH